MENEPAMPSEEPLPDRLIRLDVVCEMIGVSRATIYRMVRSGEFPEPVKIRTASLWVNDEVVSWFKARLDERRGKYRP